MLTSVRIDNVNVACLVLTGINQNMSKFTKTKFRRRANQEPFSFKTIDNEVASFEIIKNGYWKVRRLN